MQQVDGAEATFSPKDLPFTVDDKTLSALIATAQFPLKVNIENAI